MTTAAPGAFGAPASRTNLAGLAVPVFSLMAVMTRSSSLDGLRDLRGTAARLLDQFRYAASQSGVGADAVDSAIYALAATLDELAMTSEWSGRVEWQGNTLAKVYCRDEFVGVGFYDELAKVRRTTGDRTSVVEIFYYCLIAGFRGQLADRPADADKLLIELAAELGRPGEIVGDAELDAPSFAEQIRDFPFTLVLLVCVTVALVWWVVASLLVNSATSSMIRKLGG